jgi:protein involved in polysaccharide export with SLBB domain
MSWAHEGMEDGKVCICGDVAHPFDLAIAESRSLLQAIEKAGGTSSGRHKVAIIRWNPATKLFTLIMFDNLTDIQKVRSRIQLYSLPMRSL